MKIGITILQQRFVETLFNMPEPNQRQAYLQVYTKRKVTPQSADQLANRLLKKVKVQAYLKRLRGNAARKAEISVVKTIKEYSKLAFSNIKNYMNIEDDEVYFKNFEDIPEEQLAAIESVKIMRKVIKGKEHRGGTKDDDVEIQQIQFKLHSKTTALDAIMKHLGGFEKDNSQKKTDNLITIVMFDGTDTKRKVCKRVASRTNKRAKRV